MNKIYFFILISFLISGSFFQVHAQVYTGGSVGLHFDTGDYYIDVSPMVGYRHGIFDHGIAPFFSYRDERNRSGRYSYGNRFFTQITFMRDVFIHGEFEASNVETTAVGPDGKKERKWIIGLPVGGGYRYNLTERTQAYGMVLYDLILDEDSAVDNPIIRDGVVYRF